MAYPSADDAQLDASLFASVSHELLSPIFRLMHPVHLCRAMLTCRLLERAIRQDSLWEEACSSEFGVLAHHLDALPSPMTTWTGVYSLCHRSLWFHDSGRCAAWRAYRDRLGSTYEATHTSAVFNAPTLRSLDHLHRSNTLTIEYLCLVIYIIKLLDADRTTGPLQGICCANNSA
jgi:hypothetical protein